MDKNEILNKIALEKYGKCFNQILSIQNRAEILQQPLDI